MSLTAELKTRARELGFDLAGVCPAITPAGIHHFHEWLSLRLRGRDVLPGRPPPGL